MFFLMASLGYYLGDNIRPPFFLHFSGVSMRFPQIIRALSLVRPLGLAGALFSLLILAAYPLGLDVLFRPMQGGPATHPLSALALLALALGAFSWHPRQNNRAVMLVGAFVTVLMSLRLLERASGATLLDWLTPFGSVSTNL